MAELYPWLKTFHIISLIAWMAGMFYLPRLFVYHCAAEIGSVQSETFKIMERRLYNAIMRPAMAATWLFGLGLAWIFSPGIWSSGWIYAKLALVVGMSGLHGFLGKTMADFAADRNTRPARFYRILNEVPTVLLIGIVILVVVKPF
ncbi:protoporphyrinogen oxidase HemJ [Rhodoligotrophos defluvii]|uniref:protoporphyrinogen oxidase HemJ n=1 Tax=Rhodoligotrophos defluvii TaxID=2561934 RepID=UPI0010C9D84B|nr:protoporphyrinogen oxidase HemJ [Rhodoligotrophos defluvii]